MRFRITKDFHGVVGCVQVDFGLDDSAKYLLGTRHFNEVTKSWIPVFYNLDYSYKVLEHMGIGEKISQDYHYKNIGLGELEFLTIKRVA